jgi:CHAT domain-containing protein
MVDFYDRRLLERTSIAESVHLATAARLAARRAKGQTTHPFYWAGFVAAGDWR